ncbi:MAG: class B sortase [Lachnospiraceae bacterium]|nr:class B sortase [Lachnospiraceae bacterium]
MSVQSHIEADREKIRKLKEKYDLDKDEDILELFSAMQSGQIQFTSPEGRAFDDLVFEKAEGARQRRREAAKAPTKGEKPGKEKQTAPKKKRVIVLTRKEMLVRKISMWVLSLVAACCLGYFAIYCIEAIQTDRENAKLLRQKENQAVNDMYKDEVVEAQVGEETRYYTVLNQYKSLYNQHKNLIGWLKIADTIIDYPVMQTGDNDYYLDHNINQEEDRNGALFLDTDCDIKGPSTNYIIYGHNMRSGKMFGSLDSYASKSYYEKHQLIRFDTIYEEGIYQVMYVFRSRVYNQDEVVFKYYQFIDANSEEEFNSYMDEMAALSLYDTGVTATYGDQLLTLTTCDYEEEDGRFVVVAKRIE